MINNEYTIKQYKILMCVNTYRLNRWIWCIKWSEERKERNTIINNDYTIKQYIIVMCWYLQTEYVGCNVRSKYDHNMIIEDKKEKNSN